MTLNKDKHYEVIQQNNIAQTELLDILENYSKEVNTLRINAPLHGDLNLSVLAEMGLVKLNTLFSAKAKLHLLYCPKILKHFNVVTI